MEGLSYDDIESDKLFSELNWECNTNNSSDIKKLLFDQSEILNTQIIDYLLQWEELGDADMNQKQIHANASRIRNTGEILLSLNDVDFQLENINQWLDIQMECISDIRIQLLLIQNESGGLDSNWRNFQSLRDVIISIIDTLSISNEDEMTLKNSEKIIMKSLDHLKDDRVQLILNPLVNAINKLYHAISFNGTVTTNEYASGDKTNEILTSWKRIQFLNAIGDQKRKLLNLSEFFLNNVQSILSNLFGSLLKLLSLNEESNKRTSDINRFQIGVVVFDYKKHLIEQITRPSIHDTEHDIQIPNHTLLNESCFAMSNESNIILTYQRRFQESIIDFVGLYEGTFKIARKLNKVSNSNLDVNTIISASYISTLRDQFYSPMLKAMLQEFRAFMTTSRASPITLSSVSKFRYKESADIIIPLRTTKVAISNSTTKQYLETSELLQPWEIFEIIMILISPVLLREEAFFKVPIFFFIEC